MENKSKKRSGSFVNCVAIDRNDNNRQSILPHIHENRLELFYVCSGQGQYMVDNRYYPIGEGDIVICNQGVLHGEEPEQVRQIRSYSVALTGVQVEGLPPNCLIAAGEYPVVSCGQLAAQVGETMRLLYLLSGDAAAFLGVARIGGGAVSLVDVKDLVVLAPRTDGLAKAHLKAGDKAAEPADRRKLHQREQRKHPG